MTEIEPVDMAFWQVPSADIHVFAPRRADYCVCIPIINEGERIKAQLAIMQGQNISHIADILILDGGSTDGSTDPEFLKSCDVRALLVKTGPGKLSAQLRMGYAFALREGYQGIVTVDGNNKDGTEAIPSFVRELQAGYDLVQGSRFIPDGEAVNTPLSRLLAIKLIHAPLISLGAGFRYTDTTNGFRGYSRKFLLSPKVQPFRDVFATYELLAYLSVRSNRAGYKVKEIPVARRYPDHGKTPTKIKRFRGNLKIIVILLRAVLGVYNP